MRSLGSNPTEEELEDMIDVCTSDDLIIVMIYLIRMLMLMGQDQLTSLSL